MPASCSPLNASRSGSCRWSCCWPAAAVQAQQAPTPPPSKQPSPPAEPLPPPVPGGDAAQSRFFIKAEKGFIDDPFDLAPEAGVLAVLLTDAASFARVDLVDLGHRASPSAPSASAIPSGCSSAWWWPDGNAGVVLISRDAGTGRRSAQYYDAEGKAAGHPGPGRRDRGGARQGRPARADRHHPRQRPRRRHVQGQPPRRPRSGPGRQAEQLHPDQGRRAAPPAAEAGRLAAGLQRDRRAANRAATTRPATSGCPIAGRSSTPSQARSPGAPTSATWSPGPPPPSCARRCRAAACSPCSRPTRRSSIWSTSRDGGAPSSCRCRCATTTPARCRSRRTSPAAPLLFCLAIDPLHPEALARRKKDHAFLDLYWARPAAGRDAGADRQGATGRDRRTPAARPHGRSTRHLDGRRRPRRRSAQAQELQPRRQPARGLPARKSSAQAVICR